MSVRAGARGQEVKIDHESQGPSCSHLSLSLSLHLFFSLSFSARHEVSRAQLQLEFLGALQQYEKGNPEGEQRLYALLSKPRYRALDLSAQLITPVDPTSGSGAATGVSGSGTTLLHEAARRKDARLIEFASKRGADVFCRDRKGKRVLDVAKDEKIRALLKQLSNNDTSLLRQKQLLQQQQQQQNEQAGAHSALGAASAPSSDGHGGVAYASGASANASTTSLHTYGPPSFKGYIGKWTNMAGRYKPRWFVLENGSLSYYHSQEEEGKQMRGSLNLRYAKLRADASDHRRFEVISDSGSRGLGRLYLRASHPVERARWVQLLQQTQDFFQLERVQSRNDAAAAAVSASGGAPLSTIMSNTTTGSTNNNASLVQPKAVRADGSAPPQAQAPIAVPGTGSGPASAAGTRAPSMRSPTPPIRPTSGLSNRSGRSLLMAFSPAGTTVGAGNNSVHNGAAAGASIRRYDTPSVLSRFEDSPNGGGGDEGYEYSIMGEEEEDADADSLADLGKARKKRGIPHESEFVVVANSLATQAQLGSDLARSLGSSSGAGGGGGETVGALQQCTAALTPLFQRYQTMVAEREAYLLRRYEQEIQAKHLWEENMRTLAQQHAEMEAALKEASEENARKRKALREARGSTLLSPTASHADIGSALAVPGAVGAGAAMAAGGLQSPISEDGSGPLTARTMSAFGGGGDNTPLATPSNVQDDAMDDDDEFFDAIESGNLPLTVEKEIHSPTVERTNGLDPELRNSLPVEPYRHLRKKLPIGKDERPSVSLWAILKNNIGKDLTKISFPVSFNEPTSMLQRMAEDMEFSECLDVAAKCEDSTKRIAYVAAFAMSNYSSTIGRIAKPFNPLLGETFEYMSVDKEFRYYSEQVSHHPPISACFAESPSWEYFGCVDAKNKFTGRTFEIRPTGVAHVNLKVPKAWLAEKGGSGSATKSKKPLQPLAQDPEKVIEHYAWNKVTTSVSGFIVGSPTIDHFGDMEITNHATGDRCVLTFKPRGWRGKDAFEIRGTVTDASGKQVWDIAGRWNSQLVARRCGAGSGDLNPDEEVSGPAPAGRSAPGASAEYLLLWKNSEKHPTPFVSMLVPAC